MAKRLKSDQPVAAITDPNKEIVIYENNSEGGPMIGTMNALWAKADRNPGRNPQPCDGSIFAYTLGGTLAVRIGQKEYIRVYVDREIKKSIGLFPGYQAVRRSGWIDLDLVTHAVTLNQADFFVLDETGKPDIKASESPEERILREFKETYGTNYGTPTILPDTTDGVGYVYKFSNGQTISVEGWADMTEVTRRKFVGLALLDPRTNAAPDGGTPGGGSTGNSGLGLPNWLLYTLGGSILLVVVVLVIKSTRR